MLFSFCDVFFYRWRTIRASTGWKTCLFSIVKRNCTVISTNKWVDIELTKIFRFLGSLGNWVIRYDNDCWFCTTYLADKMYSWQSKATEYTWSGQEPPSDLLDDIFGMIIQKIYKPSAILCIGHCSAQWMMSWWGLTSNRISISVRIWPRNSQATIKHMHSCARAQPRTTIFRPSNIIENLCDVVRRRLWLCNLVKRRIACLPTSLRYKKCWYYQFNTIIS